MSTARAPLALVVATGSRGEIGLRGQLPWRVPEDMRHFKNVTLGHAVIMGRKTFDEVGKPLKDRRNIVVTRNAGLALEGCEVVTSVEEAIARARETDPEPRVIGGSAIYAAALPLATKVYLTEIRGEFEADTYFPPFDRSEWREVERRKGETEGVEFVTLER